jgi:Tfp pilus assembly protein PilX
MSLFKSERGVALPVVMGALLVLTLLSAAMFSTAIRSSADAGSDSNYKRALAAAEAGFQTASYRLKRIKPAATMCLTTVPVTPTAGECPASAPESAGPGATFSYRVTPTGAACAALPGYLPTANDRCVTAVGTVNGVTRRVQARVLIQPSMPFAYAGVVGVDWVTLTDKVEVKDTDVGSNGPITMTGTPNGVTIDAVARPHPPGSVIRTGTTAITGGIVNSADSYGLGLPDFSKTLPPTGTNNNTALTSSGYYNSASRVLTIPPGVDYDMPAGVYNLCGFIMGAGAKVDLPWGSALAQVYIDSPRRSGSACPANTGQFIANGNGSEVKMNNGRFDANFTFYVYGTKADGTGEDILFANKAHIDAVWYAPDSTFHATNGITIHGGVAARHVLMDHDVQAKLDFAMKTWIGPGDGTVKRLAWVECRPAPTVPTDPESGC